MPLPGVKRAGFSTSERIRELFRRRSDSDRNIRDLLTDENEDLLKQIVERVLESQLALDTAAKQGDATVRPICVSASTQTEPPVELMGDETEETAKEEKIPILYRSLSTQTSANMEKPAAGVDQSVQVSLQTTVSVPIEQHMVPNGESVERWPSSTSPPGYEGPRTLSQRYRDLLFALRDIRETCTPAPMERATQQEKSWNNHIEPETYKPKFVRVPFHGGFIRICLPPTGTHKEPQPPKTPTGLSGSKIVKPTSRKPPRGKRDGMLRNKPFGEDSGEDGSDEDEPADKDLDSELSVSQQHEDGTFVHQPGVFFGHLRDGPSGKEDYVMWKGVARKFVHKPDDFHFGEKEGNGDQEDLQKANEVFVFRGNSHG